ncbi:hypothetical protein BJ170DRAFT_425728 [Xylariales sp. AK1849]|nr:hypothetical protein BJ170DRAFT_425728 [Xylariales sp. AK1849]
MGSRIASSSAPMTLQEREVLNKIQLGFLIPPLPSIFPATATQVLTTALLKAFISNLLSELRQDNYLRNIPDTDHWGLEGNEDGFLDLRSWNPRQTNQYIYKVIALPLMSDPKTLTPIHPEWAILGGCQPSRIKFLPLPNGEVFEIGESHLVLVIHYRLKIRNFSKRTRVEEKKKHVVISADLQVVDLVQHFKSIGNLSETFELPNSASKLRTTDTRTAADLGWKHGTELRLEIL